MSTQHPDNVANPFFSDHALIQGETEVKEAYYVFSHLGCREQMWDCEGKEVDNFVIEKLLSRYEHFFKENVIGKDIFMTLRVPNPAIEKNEGKILLETLESIPRNYDIARALYSDVAPIFEVILPMTSSAAELERIWQYYKKIVVGKESTRLVKNDVRISEWIGDFKPSEINVIPLVEDFNSLLGAARITGEYIKNKRLEYERVFLARSDPALNYGSVSAVLLNKLSLQRLHSLEEKTSVEILPIIGVGSAPFRGNMKPTNIRNCATEYPSVQTFTVQSAFKYDYPEKNVCDAIDELNGTKRGKPLFIEEGKTMRLIKKVMKEYQSQITLLFPLINSLAKHVPSRRSRKLHIGLFGYSRSLKGIKLPRVISFCASLYSIGVPPEALGLSALTEKDLDELKTIYVGFEEDLRDALAYMNENNFKYLPAALGKKLKKAKGIVEHGTDARHAEITSRVLRSASRGDTSELREDIEKAAWIRKFLG